MLEEANRAEVEIEKDVLEVCKSMMQALALRTEALGKKPSSLLLICIFLRGEVH
jgi:hypothetical protein